MLKGPETKIINDASPLALIVRFEVLALNCPLHPLPFMEEEILHHLGCNYETM